MMLLAISKMLSINGTPERNYESNWLYLVDALRPRDIREMGILLSLVQLCQIHAQQFVIWGYSLQCASC